MSGEALAGNLRSCLTPKIAAVLVGEDLSRGIRFASRRVASGRLRAVRFEDGAKRKQTLIDPPRKTICLVFP